MPSPETTKLPPISSIADHVGGSCEDGYIVQFILTDEAEYRAWMAWLRGQRIKGLEAAPVFSMAADPETTTEIRYGMASTYKEDAVAAWASYDAYRMAFRAYRKSSAKLAASRVKFALSGILIGFVAGLLRGFLHHG